MTVSVSDIINCDKMKAQENQTDSVAKLVKDLIVRKAITWVRAAAPVVGLVLSTPPVR